MTDAISAFVRQRQRLVRVVISAVMAVTAVGLTSGASAGATPSSAGSQYEWPCPGLTETVTASGAGGRVVVTGSCFGGKRIRLVIRQHWTGSNNGYRTLARGSVFGHRVTIRGTMSVVDDFSPLRVRLSGGGTVSAMDGGGTPVASLFGSSSAGTPTRSAVTFGFRGQNYFCSGHDGSTTAPPLDISTAPFGVSHVQGELAPADGQGLVFGLCAAMVEASHPHFNLPWG